MISRIGKCLSCKAISRRDYTEQRKSVVGKGMYMRETMRFGLQRASRFVFASEDMCCPRCGKESWNAKKIDGFATATRCDARCSDAKGHTCECACGGKNHGKGFMVCEAVAA